MTAVFLALAASAAWGGADFLGGRASRAASALTVAAFSKLIGATGLGLACVTVAELPGGAAMAWSLGAGAVGAGGLVALYRALALGPMSLVAPLTACGGAVPVIVALALGDVPGLVTAAGLALAFAGALVVSRPASPDGGVPGMRRIALLHSLAAAAGIGLAVTFLQQAAKEPDPSAIGISFVAAAVSVVVLGAIAASRGTGTPPPTALLPAVAGCGLLDTAANVLLTEATAVGSAAVVAVLGSLYPLATVLLARAMLAERLSRSQAAGVVAAMTGVALIAAGV
jgi:drug/metabolite transporter (DMT)-like permease